MVPPGKLRHYGAASSFVDSRLAGGHVAFPLDDLVRETGLSVTGAKCQLRRLGRRVSRISRLQGFFLIVNPEHQLLGAPPVEWWLDDYFRWLGHPYYLALQSAAGFHGSNPQAIQMAQVMTDRPRREVAVGRLRIRFFVKRQLERTPAQEVTGSYAPLRVSTPAATALDLVKYAPRIGGIGRAAETIAPLLAGIHVAELRQLLDLEGEVSSAQRLGYIVEKLGCEKLARTIHAWLPEPLPWVPLSGAQGDGRSDADRIPRWHVFGETALA